MLVHTNPYAQRQDVRQQRRRRVGQNLRVFLGETGNDGLVADFDDNNNNNHSTATTTTQQRQQRQQLLHSVALCGKEPPRDLQNLLQTSRVHELSWGPTTGSWFLADIVPPQEGGDPPAASERTATRYWYESQTSSTVLGEYIRQEQQENLEPHVSFGRDEFGNETCVVWQCRANDGNTDDGISSLVAFSTSPNCNPEVYQYLDQALTRGRDDGLGRRLVWVRLFANNAYALGDSTGQVQCGGLPESCSRALSSQSSSVLDVAVSADDNWIVLYPDSYACSEGIFPQLQDYLNRYYYADDNQRTTNNNDSVRDPPGNRVSRDCEGITNINNLVDNSSNNNNVVQASQGPASSTRSLMEMLEATANPSSRTFTNATKLANDLECILQLKQQLQEATKNFHQTLEHMPPDDRRAWADRLHNGGPLLLPSAATTTKREMTECVICQDGSPTRACIPCGHYCLCGTCADRVVQCPVCRSPVQDTLRIF